MKFIETKLKGAYSIELNPKIDNRGFFLRAFCKNDFKEIGFNKEIVQINHTQTQKKGAFRGFHFQYPPFAETKIIRCIKGKVLDVFIDLRLNSPTFLKNCMIELSADNFKTVLIPEGFAHGFQVLEDNSEMIYFHTAFYNQESEGALNYLDHKLNITLPIAITEISDRDNNHPFINDIFKGIKA
jgi:dTDP-4-dehydrorhamnose 3,5-epimerase